MYARSQGRPTHPGPDDEIDALPDHLASLVERDCDEVLSDEMIQRAWNLAWNKPSAHHTKANTARDAVVEDHAIRSPLDAVAAWYSHMTIDDTLSKRRWAALNKQMGRVQSVGPRPTQASRRLMSPEGSERASTLHSRRGSSIGRGIGDDEPSLQDGSYSSRRAIRHQASALSLLDRKNGSKTVAETGTSDAIAIVSVAWYH